MNYKAVLIVAIATLLAVANASAAKGKPMKSFDVTEPKVIGALFYADWCGSCKTLDPKLKSVQKSYVNKPVLFTQFDVTNLSAQYQSNLFAHTIGLEHVLEEIGVKTGFMVLINRDSGKIVGQIDRDDSPSLIKEKIDAAIAAAG